ncbi:ABC transporter substrate-binding protein [Heyndrickxia sp. NPDC080065]|uniref:ABC transporter substrate-binding protein n=1 Tax=Heyndrickxia sp. NPDC080065 TaxID=3390568 RepID=UPI003D049F9D
MKKFLKFIPLFILALILTACGTAQDKGKTSESKPKTQDFPVTITDGVGNKVTINKKPQRIVSLLPSNTETAFALGLDKEIVGVSDFDNYPEQVKDREKIGGQEFNIEKIISLKPDIVLATASNAHNSKDGLKQLENANIKVIVVNDASSFDDVYKSIELIGEATGTKEKAQEIVDGMKSKVADIKAKAEGISKENQQKVWIEVSAPPTIYTTGKGTFMGEMLDTLGAKNIAGDKEGWIQFSEEAVVKANPDVMILTYGYYDKDAVNNVYKRKSWKEVAAIKNKRVYNVDSDKVSRSGPRLAEGLEEMAKAIYPDTFK